MNRLALDRAFILLGLSLFMAGLVTGLLTGALANPRMGLSAHMQGLTNGMFLIAVGAAWHLIDLRPALARLAFVLLAYGTVANWGSTLLAALWHTGDLTPIHAPAPTAAGWQEAIVSFGLLSLTAAMIGGTALLIFGAWHSHRRE